ncbi:MAG: S8 family serine peptidase [Opitutaceae bacterium]|jgi:subtilisin family serine protease
MKNQLFALARLAPLILILAAPSSYSQAAAKKTVASQADMPRHSYAVEGLASALVQADDATFGVFASKVRADIESDLRDYDIKDRSTLRDLLSAKLSLQEIGGEYEAALATVDALRALEDKPSPKLTTGILARAYLKAAIGTRSAAGPEFEEAFGRRYMEEVNPLPWDVVSDWAKQSYASARLAARAVGLAFVMTELDPAVLKSHALDESEAEALVRMRAYTQVVVPHTPVQARVLKLYIAAHNSVKPDIWAAREVTLTADQPLAPVLVAIWDSGIDTSLFPGQVFDDPHPTASGAHGLAVDDFGAPSTSWLYPLTPEQQARYPEVRNDVKGRLDIEEGYDSPEAVALEKKRKTGSPEQLHQLAEISKVIEFYMHGTHCAGIAVRGNPAARLVVARFDDDLADLPFPPTPEWARRMAADFRQMSDYFRTRNVRVVNMSWGDDRQEFEMWLSKTGGGADPAERKRRADELYTIWREAVESAIKGAPGTLFVTAAGNSDSNTGFTEDVPSSLRLPNLIAVGAVNQAGDETSFTSYGDSVAVHADGYDVDSQVPGGSRLRQSGTSMASPNVVNLAAKLFALDPSLTPEQAIDLIKRGATATEDGRRILINEKRSVALLPAHTGT